MADLTTLAKTKAWLGLGMEVEPATIPLATGPYTVTVAKATAWQGDSGVLFSATGVPLAKVMAPPAAGQFSVAAGVYTFNSGDAGKALRIAYLTFNVDDNLLAQLITAASAFILTYLSWDIFTASYSEYRDGPGRDCLSVKNYPITAVSAVELNGVAIPAATDQVAFGYLFDERQIILRGFAFTRGRRNVKITYTAGYASAPAELEQACLELVAYKYRSRDWTGQSSKIIGGENVTYVTKEMPDSVKLTLKRWSRVAPI